MRVSNRRIIAAIDTLGDLTTEQHEQLDGRTRDEIAHVRHVLEEILESRTNRSAT